MNISHWSDGDRGDTWLNFDENSCSFDENSCSLHEPVPMVEAPWLPGEVMPDQFGASESCKAACMCVGSHWTFGTHTDILCVLGWVVSHGAAHQTAPHPSHLLLQQSLGTVCQSCWLCMAPPSLLDHDLTDCISIIWLAVCKLYAWLHAPSLPSPPPSPTKLGVKNVLLYTGSHEVWFWLQGCQDVDSTYTIVLQGHLLGTVVVVGTFDRLIFYCFTHTGCVYRLFNVPTIQ